MSEEEKESVEAVEAEAVAPASESEQVHEKEETAQERKRRNDVEYNWAESRRKMQDLERQNRDMQDQLQKLQTPRAEKPEDDELDKLGDDDIVTKAQAKKMAAKMAREIAQEVIKQRENATVDDRLQMKYPDFVDTVTRENIELLKQTEPELAMSLAHISDPYTQGVAAYKLLKRNGIGEEMKAPKEKQKAVSNSQKPVSVNAVTKQSAIGNAHLFENGLTPELKKQLWAEMQQLKKMA
jgi:hypothetical protein